MDQPPVMVILGPTASGKSSLALELAAITNAEIISADSRQIYCELTIGAAKPLPEALREVKHHFVNEKHIGEPFSAGDFATEASQRILDIHRRGKRAVVAGGSTLYLQGLLEGFADLPAGDATIRERLQRELESVGNEQLFLRLLKRDPQQAATLDPTKTQRLIRSLEIIEITGMSVTELHRRGKKAGEGLHFVTTGLAMPRATLYQRINQRCDEMFEAGLCNEAFTLYNTFREQIASKTIAPLQSVGYQELFQYFDGEVEYATAVALVKQHTRNYAKRQLTFFRNRLTINWVETPETASEVTALVKRLASLKSEDY